MLRSKSSCPEKYVMLGIRDIKIGCVLKVNIHCGGCEEKVKKLLQKIDGVYCVRIDADEGKVVVAGDVDPGMLVKKLKRGGKHAEIWGGQKGGMMYNQKHPIKAQFQNMQGKDNKYQNDMGQKRGQVAHFPNIKGAQVLPAKEHKSVKFNLPEENLDASDDGYDDSFYGEEERGFGHGQRHRMGVPGINDSHKDNGVGGRKINTSIKKRDVVDEAMLMKGKGGNKKSDGGLLGRFLSFGKKNKKVELEEATYTNKRKNAGNKKGKEGKLEGRGNNNSKNDFDFYDTSPRLKNAQNAHVGNIPVMNGLDEYHQGVQMQHAPYNNLQQQQYMGNGMTMNQHQQANMYPTSMLYGTPHPYMNYMPPPPMPTHPMADPITHTFSDENVESCSIM
ncbi:hypothetical protein VNO78_18392 [Psophocarpus tetragonolobus]|uniref:HMA domain-containing protein n=1 Tax=Psophocarpus tetragonolobus TaxID=3891 RepID=A0AAN9SKU7_PSOTE